MDLNESDENFLRDAFVKTGLWPLYFLSTDQEARSDLDLNEEWVEQDLRALLLIKRAVPHLDIKVVGRHIFPNRQAEAAQTKFSSLLSVSVPGWNRANDVELLLEWFRVGHRFSETARERFGNNFSRCDLEIAQEIAWAASEQMRKGNEHNAACTGKDSGVKMELPNDA